MHPLAPQVPNPYTQHLAAPNMAGFSTRQKTLRQSVTIRGIGLHSGQETAITLHPAGADTGVVFRLTKGGQVHHLPAKSDYVTRTILSTNLGHGPFEVRTVEHLMAALRGLEVDNVEVEVAGCEVPMMDGSSMPFAQPMQQAGLKTLSAPRRLLRVLEPIELRDDETGKFAGLYPSNRPTFSFRIDFNHPAIQTQELSVPITPDSFLNELASARTFGFEDDLHTLQQQGLALGAGLSNAVGLGRDGTVLNPGGLRFSDEFVRHKILDAIGDLSLVGYPLLADYRGVRSGHAMNLKLMHHLADQPDRWEIVSADELAQARAV
ncbi:MAG: UDP-3-O-acyl-N-acetylglucosamine deacetylase [Deltaproteobacteria bacterium]|nr:UDP-3-O-acyl-N-acetylglucosamine deacetylase [Deltaproteobacteria bacterium]